MFGFKIGEIVKMKDERCVVGNKNGVIKAKIGSEYKIEFEGELYNCHKSEIKRI